MFIVRAKRGIALILALAAVFTMIPVQAAAAEGMQYNQGSFGSGLDTEPPEESTNASSEEYAVIPAPSEVPGASEAYLEMQALIDEILAAWLGEDYSGLSNEDIRSRTEALDEYSTFDAYVAIYDFEESFLEALTEDETANLLANNHALCTFADVLGENVILPVTYAARTVTVLDGQVSITDSVGTGSASGDTVTITATGSRVSKRTNNITITNQSGNPATLSFDYSVSSAFSFNIDGEAAGNSGTYSKLLEPDASIDITLQSKNGAKDLTATLNLSNFSLEAGASTEIVFEYDGTLGTVTADGNTVESGAAHKISSAGGIALEAISADGCEFLGWVDGDGKVISIDTSHMLMPDRDMYIKAVFIGEESAPHFGVGIASPQQESTGAGKRNYYTVNTNYAYIFDDLNAAGAAAATVNSASDTIVLLNNGTLPAGSYTIPAGVTLLIPFDAANTMFTAEAASVKGIEKDKYVPPAHYRTLAMAYGANIILDGAMSVSARHYAGGDSGGYAGLPADAAGVVHMQGNSSITVNKGGALYAYGFITGSGTVTVKSGAEIYENLQITDFRGSKQSADMLNDVFPFSQYYVQNIQVPITLEQGAREYGYTSVSADGATFGSLVSFIGPNDSMFNLTSGSVTKRYDESKDMLMLEADGDITIDSISMNIGISVLDSENYVLPINSNITITAKSGSKLAFDKNIALLPGAEIIIEQNAVCTLEDGVSVYVYDTDQWGEYCGPDNEKLIPAPYAPGKDHTRTNADLADAKVQTDGLLDASKGYLYTTQGGANICSRGTGEIKINAPMQSAAYQFVQDVGYVEILLTSAGLKNPDGSYADTEISIIQPNTYICNEGKWVCKTYHTAGEQKADVKESCTADGYIIYECSACKAEYKEPKPQTGHDYTNQATTPPSCEDVGIRTFVCTKCGDEYTEEIEAMGHTEAIDSATVPGCENTGLTQGKHCSVCNEILAAQEVIPPLGHDIVQIEAKHPTLDNVGWHAYEECARNCGYTTYKEIPALQQYGLYELEGEYYYILENGKLATDVTCYVAKTNGLLNVAAGYYCFDANGRLVKTGFVTDPDYNTYYYNNLVMEKGLARINGQYYIFDQNSGIMLKDTVVVIDQDNACNLAAGSYPVGPDGILGERIAVAEYLQVFSSPDRQVYYKGDAFDAEGLDVRLVYDDGSTVDVTDDVEITGFDSTGDGEKTITVCYGEYTDTFKVYVFSFSSVSLSLNGRVIINFYANFPGMSELDYTPGILFFRSAPGEDEILGAYQRGEGINDYAKGNDGSLMFSYDKLAAKEMNDLVYAVLYAELSDGRAVFGTPSSISIAQYAPIALESYKGRTQDETDAFRRLMVDMLNYGAAAQNEFKYRTDALANSGIGKWKSYETTIAPKLETAAKQIRDGLSSDRINVAGVTLSLENELSINFYMNVDGSVKSAELLRFDDYTVGGTYNAATASEKVEAVEHNGQYAGFVHNIAAKEMRDYCYVRMHVEFEDGTEAYSDILRYSVESYAANIRANNKPTDTIRAAMENMMKYGDSASAYFAYSR